MTRTQTPTLGDARWGPCPSDRFDFYRNPASSTSMHPLILSRHGGGGHTGTYRDSRTDLFGETFFFDHWLHGAWNSFGQNPTLPWDFLAFSSGQRGNQAFTGSPQDYSPIPAAHRSIYFPDAIRDCQRATANIKRLAGTTVSGVALNFDNGRILGHGESYGGTLMGLAQLGPPLQGDGGRNIWNEGIYAPCTHDSRLRGVYMWEPQVKCDVSYMWAAPNYSGWFGGRADTSSAQDVTVFGQQLRWTEATRLLDISGTWHRNGFSGILVGDRVNIRGVNATAGVYTVELVNSSIQIKLTTSPGASAFFINNCNWGNATKLITTPTSGAFSSMEPGDKIWLTAGTGCTLGEYTVASVLSGTSITLTADINGAGGNIGDNSIAFYSGYYGGAQLIEHGGSVIRDMASITRYFEAGNTDFYPGFYVIYPVQGTHVLPYNNPHDSAQFDDIQTAIVNAGYTFNGQRPNAGVFDASSSWTDGSAVATSALPSATYQRYLAIEAWMASQVS